jgi:hypothetical protein
VLAALTFVAAFAAITVMSQGIPRRDLHRFDQSFYLGAAYDLYWHGKHACRLASRYLLLSCRGIWCE